LIEADRDIMEELKKIPSVQEAIKRKRKQDEEKLEEQRETSYLLGSTNISMSDIQKLSKQSAYAQEMQMKAIKQRLEQR